MQFLAVDWTRHITVDPSVNHGRATLRSTRVPVTWILRSLAEEAGYQDVLALYPEMSAEDITACLKYAAEAVARPVYYDMRDL